MLIGNDRYRLVEVVGQGGLGRVWRARDEVLGREVAVKQLFISPRLDDAARQVLTQRATSGARAAARLRHPGIVAVHDIVEHDGVPWIVMDFIPGPSLGTLIAENNRPDWRKVAAIGVEVADALAYAHAADVVHRDLKPDNILLAGDRPVITDFGIARLLDTTDRPAHAHSIVGTPQYMAPEQLEGREVTGACDIWALGATLFAVLEGETPFDGPTLMSVVTAVLNRPLPRPREAGPLGDVLSALTEKQPERRPDAAAASARLRSILQRDDLSPSPVINGEPPTAPEPMPTRPDPGPDRVPARGPDLRTEPGPMPEPSPLRTTNERATPPDAPSRQPTTLSGLSRRTLIVGGAGIAATVAGGTAAALLLPGHRSPKRVPATTRASFGTLRSYRGTVHTLAFSPDGKILVSGTDDHAVPLWDVASGALIGTLVGHTDKVPIVAYSPDGKHIASSSDDSTIRLWDATNRTALATIIAGNGTVGLAFSPDGKTLATITAGVTLWDVATGDRIKYLLDGSDSGFFTVAYSPDGKLLAEGCFSSEVGLWSVADFTGPSTIAVNSEAWPHQVAFSPDSRTLAVANSGAANPTPGNVNSYYDTDVQLIDVATRTVKATLGGFTNSVNSVAFSPDGAVLAASGTDSAYHDTVRLFDVSTQRTTRVITSTTGAVNYVTYSSDGKLLALASNTIQLMTT